MHCNFQYLFKGHQGYIVRCNQCRYYQIAFGCVMLTISYEEFNDLYTQVKHQYNNTQLFCSDADTKSIIINTANSNYNIIVSPAEITGLYEMFDQADNEIKALDLLELFNYN